MTADVNANVNVNVSTIEAEDKCGLDMSSHEGLPTAAAAADCSNGDGIGKGNAGDDPDASYVFVAGAEAVDVESADGKSEPIEKVGSLDWGADNDAAELVVHHGGSRETEVSLGDEKEIKNGAVEAPNGCCGEMEAEQGEVDIDKVVEQSKEPQIHVFDSDFENKSLEVSMIDEKAEENCNSGSTVTEESQVTSFVDIAESDPNHSDHIEVESCKNIVEPEQSPSGENEVINKICTAESQQGQLGKAEVISCNNIAESEQCQFGEAEAIGGNSIAESEHNHSGKVEVSSTIEVGESELNQSGNSEDKVEVSSKTDLVSNIEEKQDSFTTFTEEVQDDNDVDLSHGKESVEFTSNASKDPQEASEVELSQNTEATSCLVEAGVNLETEDISDVTLSEEYVNGFSAGRAEDGVAETGVLDGIAAAPLENGGSKELGRSQNLVSSDAEVGISYPAASADDSIKYSKNEYDMPVIQLESGAINDHVACQNGETLPTDHAEECDLQEDFSHSSQTSPDTDGPSEVTEAVLTNDVAIAKHGSNPVDPVSDTALEVDSSFSCSCDAALEPVVNNGYFHPIHGSETYEVRAETVDEKLIAVPSTPLNDAIPETKSNTFAIKFGEVPALSSYVVKTQSEVSSGAGNNIGDDPDREVCVHDLVESAIDVRPESEVENSVMVPREVPCDGGPASESELFKDPVDVKAESEAEDSVVVPGEDPHNDGPQSESVSIENPIDVTAESQDENSSMSPRDGPASKSQILDSGGRTHNDLQVENKGNQLLSTDGDEKTSEKIDVASADNQEEAPASLPDGIDGQNLVAEGTKRPFYYMIKIPRYDNGESLREQIKHAQNQVDKKTKSRDVIRAEMQKQRVKS